MAIRAQNLIKEFGTPPTRVLHDINFKIADGEFVSISGKSGSGKTTLLYLLSTLDRPSQGLVELDGEDPSQMEVAPLHQFRNAKIGFIFQFHYLLPELSALENVLLPARKTHQHLLREERARFLLKEFSLEGKEGRLPSQLSGGEQQRVAIARALIMNPKFIFADEPTGNLDSANGITVMNLLRKINEEEKTTIVLVTHEPEYASMARRQIFLTDGRVSRDEGGRI